MHVTTRYGDVITMCPEKQQMLRTHRRVGARSSTSAEHTAALAPVVAGHQADRTTQQTDRTTHATSRP